jgi:hypothetical protein
MSIADTGLQDQRGVGWTSSYALHRRHLAVAAACLALLYLAGVTGQWWPSQDSAVYLGLGRSLAEGQGYHFNGEVNTDFTPGLPLILAGLSLIGGEGFWLPNLLMAICGIAALAISFLTLRRLTGDPVRSLAIALTTGVSYAFYSHSHIILTDMPFALVFWSVVGCAARAGAGGVRWIAVAAGLSVVGVLLRGPGIVLLAPMALGLVLDRHIIQTKRRRIIAAATIAFAVVGVAGVLLALAHNAAPQTPHYVKLFMTPSGFWGYLRRLCHGVLAMPSAWADVFTGQAGFWPAGIVFLALQAIGSVRFWSTGRKMIPVIGVLYSVSLAICMSSFGMRSRYLAPIEPLMLLLALDGLCWCVRTIGVAVGSSPRSAWYLWAVLAFCGAGILCNLPRTGRNAFYYSYCSYHSHPREYYQAIRGSRYADLAAMADILRRQCAPSSLVAASVDDIPILHFLSHRKILVLPESSNGHVSTTRSTQEQMRACPNLAFVVLRARPTEEPAATRPEGPGKAIRLQNCYRGQYYVLYHRL